MADTDIGEALLRLETAPAPAVERVDEGPPLESRVAVLPASFNPPTIAHVELLDRARDVPGVAMAAAMLTTRNVDKNVSGAGFYDRVAMLLALALPATGVLVSTEARISDQAALLRSAFSGHTFDFVVGYDTLIRLFDQRYYHGDMEDVLAGFFAHHRLIAATRGGFGVEEIERYLDAEREAQRFADRILPLALAPDLAHVSSTQVRASVAGGVVDVPSPVAEYIHERGLYADA